MIDWAEAELLRPGPEISYLWEIEAGSELTRYCILSKIAFREKRKLSESILSGSGNKEFINVTTHVSLLE